MPLPTTSRHMQSAQPLSPLSFEKASAAAAPFVLAFGDSLTAGYGLAREEAFPARLQALLRLSLSGAVVHNAGVSGDTTRSSRASAAPPVEPQPATRPRDRRTRRERPDSADRPIPGAIQPRCDRARAPALLDPHAARLSGAAGVPWRDRPRLFGHPRRHRPKARHQRAPVLPARRPGSPRARPSRPASPERGRDRQGGQGHAADGAGATRGGPND